MCLYPRILKNKKYTVTIKNKGNIPDMKDERTKYIAVGCNRCIECTKRRANNWKVRLYEEIQQNKNGKFVTLTFNNESLKKFEEEFKNTPRESIDNEIATRAVRLFLERYRKQYKVSLRHWLITELGHKNTERLHIHGIIFIDDPKEIEKYWQYGWTYIGEYVNEKTINYISKYVTKQDEKHKWFSGKILASSGIGNNYTNKPQSKNNKFNGNETKEIYITRQGKKTALPMYYRNKLYSEEERELLWINKLNENIRYVCGEKIDVSTKEGEILFEKCQKIYQRKNTELGYGKITWDQYKYKKDLKKLNKKIVKPINITKITQEKEIGNSAKYNNSLNNWNGDF